MAPPKLPLNARQSIPVRAKKKATLESPEHPQKVLYGSRAMLGLHQLKEDVSDHIEDKDNPHGTNFLNLTDTPPDYTGAAGQSVLVSSGEDGVVFGPPNVPVVTASIVLGIGDGTIEGDTNATDFTGNEYADGTSLTIPPNSIVRIYHDTIAYDYIGFKNTTIGIGGAYVTVAGDYQPVGVGDHGHLDGLTDDDHPQYHNDTRGDERYYLKSEVDDSQAEQDAKLVDHEEDPNPHGKLNWHNNGEWEQGYPYQEFDVVVDGDWTMVANKETGDRPAPQPIGEAEWFYPDVIDFDVNVTTASSVFCGVRITMTNYGYGVEARVYIPIIDADIRYMVAVKNVSSGAIDYAEIYPDRVGWYYIVTNMVLYSPGDVLDAVLITLNQGAQYTEDTFSYTYRTPRTQSVLPSAGMCDQPDDDTSNIYISREDQNGRNSTTWFSGMKAGDTLSFQLDSGQVAEWVLTAPPTRHNNPDDVDYYAFPVSPSVNYTDEAVKPYSMTFRQYLSVPVTYADIPDYWVSRNDIVGLYGEGSFNNVVPDENGYGVDILIQEAGMSPDWDFLAWSRNWMPEIEDLDQRKLENTIAEFIPQSGNAGTGEGNVWYDEDSHTLCVKTDIPDVTLNVGTEEHVRVVNRTGSTILNGKAVSYAGNDTATMLPSVTLALAIVGDFPRVGGIATHDIGPDEEGWITTFGLVGTDTSSYSEGVALYLSDVTPGEFTDIPPDVISRIGGVTYSAVDGRLFVIIDNLMSWPTTIGYMGGATLPTTIDETPYHITGFVNSGNVITAVDPTNGIATLDFEGIYRVTINMSLLFTDVNRGRALFIDVVGASLGVVGTFPFAVGRNSPGASIAFASPLPLTAGEAFHLEIYGNDTFDNVETYNCIFDIESIHIS